MEIKEKVSSTALVPASDIYLMNNLVKDVWNNLARVEIWEDGRFSRCCAEVARGNVEAYELIVNGNTNPVSLLLRWRLPITLSSFAIDFAVFKNKTYAPDHGAAYLEYLDGAHWKKIEGKPVVDNSGEAQDTFYRRLGVTRWIYNFPKVSTHQLRFHVCVKPEAGALRTPCIIRDLECFERRIVRPKQSSLSKGNRFIGRKLQRKLSESEIRRIDLSDVDRLGRRILRSRQEPDYTSVAAPLFPMNFCKSAIGRIDDGNETVVTWNGTLIMVEGVEDAAWNHYSEESMAAAWKDQLVLIMKGMDKCIDRWFAFAVGKPGELIGSHLSRTSQEWLEGFKPGVRTTYRHGEQTYTFSAFVAPDKSKSYLNIVEVEVENRSVQAAETDVSVIMGKHASEAMHETQHPALGSRFRASQNPLFFAPHPTGYQQGDSDHTVRNALGEIMLHSSLAGQLKGNDREPIFKIPLRLAPGEKKIFQVAVPGVAAPITRDPQTLPAALPAFRTYWANELSGRTVIDTPESHVNDFSRNAIAQILITLLNRGKLKYGSYWYEEYYGIEEGEAVMALAKFGYAAEAKAATEIMLSQELLDPNGYHHQYRHGVAAQIAAEVYSLDGDKAWLELIAPRLEEVGRWIIGATRSESGRFAGLLPKRTYGGDIATPARNISTNARCWRGLRDAGLMLKEVGRDSLADCFLTEAAAYRRRIIRLLDLLVDRDGKYPFVPMGLDIGLEGSETYQD